MSSDKTEAKCPFNHAAGGGASNRDWWPNQLRLDVLHQHSSKSDPLGEKFDYAEEFKKLDYAALKKDLLALMTDSQDWWPADFGHYGPQFIRMSWHAAGTYRTGDGRGGGGRGQQRFAPLNSWPDNVNIDKSRRLLWPIKQKYGQTISWADLLILAGNVALESMGFRTFGFGGGRADVWEPDQDVNWGSETTWLADDKRFSGERELDQNLAATHMGLIYVNPEGPNASGDYLAAAKDIRATFGRMAMDDEETVALIAGGHTFGKAHGAAPESHKGAGTGRRAARGPGPGLDQQLRQGPRRRHRFQRSRSDLDHDAGPVGQQLLREPVQVRMGADQEPGRRQAVGGQGRAGNHPGRARPVEEAQADDADDRFDTALRPGVRQDLAAFLDNPQAFAEAFARAWYKLTHRDMGPKVRYLGPEVPKEDLIWQDPLPQSATTAPREPTLRTLKARIAGLGLVGVGAGVDGLGLGVHLPRLRQARRRQRRAHPPGSAEGLGSQQSRATGESAEGARSIQSEFNGRRRGKVSLADVIVLAGGVGVEQAAKAAGVASKCRSRRDASMPRRIRPTSSPSPSSNRSPMVSATT